MNPTSSLSPITDLLGWIEERKPRFTRFSWELQEGRIRIRKEEEDLKLGRETACPLIAALMEDWDPNDNPLFFFSEILPFIEKEIDLSPPEVHHLVAASDALPGHDRRIRGKLLSVCGLHPPTTDPDFRPDHQPRSAP